MKVAKRNLEQTFASGEFNDAIFVLACGYESRALTIIQKLHKKGLKISNDNVICFSFDSFKDQHHRKENEEWLRYNGIEPIEISGNDDKQLLVTLSEELSKRPKTHRLHIDYSSMTRNWYCSLVRSLATRSLDREAIFWYSRGNYQTRRLSTVGYGSFALFSGKPRLSQQHELHIFGLGLDDLRTRGIISQIDPENYMCATSRTTDNEVIYRKVLGSNKRVTDEAMKIIKLEADDMAITIGRLVDVANELLVDGDVVFVPDGPKPLVMAMSITPFFVRSNGVYCWHVSHVKPNDYIPLDVKPTGVEYGFSLSS